MLTAWRTTTLRRFVVTNLIQSGRCVLSAEIQNIPRETLFRLCTFAVRFQCDGCQLASKLTLSIFACFLWPVSAGWAPEREASLWCYAGAGHLTVSEKIPISTECFSTVTINTAALANTTSTRNRIFPGKSKDPQRWKFEWLRRAVSATGDKMSARTRGKQKHKPFLTLRKMLSDHLIVTIITFRSELKNIPHKVLRHLADCERLWSDVLCCEISLKRHILNNQP